MEALLLKKHIRAKQISTQLILLSEELNQLTNEIQKLHNKLREMCWAFTHLTICNKTCFCELCTDQRRFSVFQAYEYRNPLCVRFFNSFSHGILNNDCTFRTYKSFSEFLCLVPRGFLKIFSLVPWVFLLSLSVARISM